MEADKKTSRPNGQGAKKIYHGPELFTYGDIREITKAVGMSGNSDGGSGGAMNTSL